MPDTATYHQLVEDNHNLIFAFCNKYNLDRSEYYDLAAIGLCKAAMTFDPSLGFRFSTLAYRCMFNELTREERKKKVRNPDNVATVPLQVFEDEDDDRSLRLWNGMDFTEDIHSSIDVERFRRSLNDRETTVLRGRLMGKPYRDIGEELGLSHQAVQLALKRIQVKYNAIMGRTKKT